MSIIVKMTEDGSKTLFLPEMDETYHSVFGAKTESEHVFIEAGYKQFAQQKLNILEVGTGTGLNVFLTYLHHLKDNREIYFETLEKYPLNEIVYKELNYAISDENKLIFNKIHTSNWNEITHLDSTFQLHKKQIDLLDFSSDYKFDLVYFDAFDPAKQPELWTEKVFQNIYNHMNADGILVTYSAKGIVRRAMQSVGFKVERIPGPPGKREMIRASKS
jgi:tRNA U34 5-methylaminomethyl-2-thiouridine-forming methyltransferase MnmC